MTRRSVRPVGLGVFALTCVVALPAGCGKKGPPLPPLRIVPGPVTDISARRIGDDVILRYALPQKNEDGSTPADVAHVEIYALSAASASEAPPAQAFLREAELVGRIEVAPEQPGYAFVESLEGKPPPVSRETRGPKEPVAPPPVTPGADDVRAAGADAQIPVAVRLYGLVPVSARGRRGALATAAAPLHSPPPIPAAPVIRYTEDVVVVEWPDAGADVAHNVYPGDTVAVESGADLLPLNQKPLAAPPFEDPRLEFGTERCYRLSAVTVVGAMPLESRLSDPACVTPVDTFPPPAPAGLAAVAGPGAISLIWDEVAAADLGGYLVLRAEAGGDTLQALTPEPIRETTYRDDAVAAGLRYIYAVVAVDRAGNASVQSATVEETAR